MKKQEIEPHWGMNENTHNLLFSDYYNLNAEEQGSLENAIIWGTLNRFTKLEQKSIFVNFIKLYIKKGLKLKIDKISYNEDTKQYEYRDGSFVLTFDMISNKINDNNLINILKSNKRKGTCHKNSVVYGHGLPNSKIVTGYITIGKIKNLHTIVEYPQNDKTIIFDWTKNLKMEKEQYITLTKFVELTSYDAKDVFYDAAIMTKFGISDIISIKNYVTFRDEIIKDLEKNLHLLSKEEQAEINSKKR